MDCRGAGLVEDVMDGRARYGDGWTPCFVVATGAVGVCAAGKEFDDTDETVCGGLDALPKIQCSRVVKKWSACRCFQPES